MPMASTATDDVDYPSLRFVHAPLPAGGEGAVRHPVVVVGAGPVGLSLAIDLAQQGVPVLLLDRDDRLASGSRAICFAQRTLEVFDRLGCGERFVQKGVSWQVGKVFFRDEQVYRFDLQPQAGHQRPAFVNLQQYYCEGYLVERAQQLQERLHLRWGHQVVAVEAGDDGVSLEVEAGGGRYRLQTDYLVACDGARSVVRQQLGRERAGRVFRDRFLIADVRLPQGGFPAERWFWFDPPFHPGQSVLLHSQPDGVWRVDFQLGWDADPQEAQRPEHLLPRLRALLGEQPFELEWVSVYTFACQRMERFREGRVLFAGDAAHRVSPFGARGANSGVQDADNLAWKLACVLRGEAPPALLDSYADEREQAADENIRHSSRATDFISPKSEVSRLFRQSVLELAKEHAFARTLVNSGRLSTPTWLPASPLNTPDADRFDGGLPPGAPATDAPVRACPADGSQAVPGWLLRQLPATGFTALLFGPGGMDAAALEAWQAAAHGLASLQWVVVLPAGATRRPALAGARVLLDAEGLLQERYDGRPGTLYLLRPDRHVCARWRRPEPAALRAALQRALCRA
ncbi:FAD-dependent oxidoreductase [Eleftheria terrae]|uniref:FAD-dependent oxidoreductase n=1 Tax=Eleftheria terrae TaxID=1597781 RepID=UPI00263A9B2F|nr:FAD-dependent oxidoreductase [Eleftheria terrae]WKB51973.1 FAD-dependent oxidoreductase [Eleftheria terrae]